MSFNTLIVSCCRPNVCRRNVCRRNIRPRGLKAAVEQQMTEPAVQREIYNREAPRNEKLHNRRIRVVSREIENGLPAINAEVRAVCKPYHGLHASVHWTGTYIWITVFKKIDFTLTKLSAKVFEFVPTYANISRLPLDARLRQGSRVCGYWPPSQLRDVSRHLRFHFSGPVWAFITV